MHLRWICAEDAMHIHNHLNIYAAEFSAISGSEVAARRAAEVRKRLLKSAQKINPRSAHAARVLRARRHSGALFAAL